MPIINLERVTDILDKSPGLKLLRSRHAGLIISFFFEAFKTDNVFSVSEYQLTQKLADFLQFLAFEHADEYEVSDSDDAETKAIKLINKWADYGFLRRYQDEQGTVIYELTSHSEKALQWLQSLDKREFVGTESRFKDIFNKLKELVEFSSEDPEKRLEELKQRRTSINEEIRRIKSTGKVEVFDTYQIKSRLAELTHSARELLSDFSEVEENFHDITRGIYQKHTDPSQTKGTILSFAFDALDELRDSDQGKSFYAFWEFLLTRTKQEKWKEMVDRLLDLLELRAVEYDDFFLRKMKTYLYKNGQKVYDANDRMAEKLSRIISEKEITDRIKVRQTIKEIKEMALTFAEKDMSPDVAMTIEQLPEISLPMERKLIIEQYEAGDFMNQPEDCQLNTEELHGLANVFAQFHVDRKELENNIETLLERNRQVSLKDITHLFPVEKGLSEIVCYFNIAKDRPSKSFFNEDVKEDIVFTGSKIIRVPQIIFTK